MIRIFGKAIIPEEEYDKLQEIKEHDCKAMQLLCDLEDEYEEFIKELKNIIEDNIPFDLEKYKAIKKLVSEYDRYTD